VTPIRREVGGAGSFGNGIRRQAEMENVHAGLLNNSPSRPKLVLPGRPSGKTKGKEKTMKRRMSGVGLTLLLGVALAAILAPGASAAATAYTCESGGTGFGNADCSTAGTGFHDEAFPANTSTGLQVKTLGASLQVLRFEEFGAEIELTATGVECVECMVENSTAGAEMEVKGGPTIEEEVPVGEVLRYSGVAISGSLGTTCQVKGGVIRTEPLAITANATNSLTIQPNSGTVVAEFEIKNKPGHVCVIPGLLKLEGLARGNVAGAEVTFNTGEGELTIAEESASLIGTTTLSAGVTGAEQHPIVLT
jgi:hypothetical protein